MITSQSPKQKTVKKVAKKKSNVQDEVEIVIDLPKIIKEREQNAR